jgi:hypothetical protein
MALATTVILSNALIQKVALEPLITAPLLYLLIRKPQVFRDIVLQRLPSLNDNTALVTALKWLVGLGIGRNISYLMNKWALNNWQLRTTKSQWDWKNEVVVVTGGCSGFGEKVSIGLAEKGLKVVVLDVSDLPKSLQGCTFPATLVPPEPYCSLATAHKAYMNDFDQTQTSPSTNATSPPPLPSPKSPTQSARRKGTPRS